ncbi:MAG TPA: hypothetical protein VIX63_14985 [Vicinamibacterales bacterium]
MARLLGARLRVFEGYLDCGFRLQPEVLRGRRYRERKATKDAENKATETTETMWATKITTITKGHSTSNGL